MSQQGDTTNIVLGLCNVRFDGTQLGLTKGGVEVNITQTSVDVVVDDYGDTPVDSYDKGTTIEVIVNMVEYGDLDLVAQAFPTATVRSDRLEFGDQAGSQISTGRLVLDPLNANDHNIMVYKARPVGNATIGFTNDDVKVFTATFMGLIDTSRNTGDQLFRIGGPSS
jgi:hypothetical protein